MLHFCWGELPNVGVCFFRGPRPLLRMALQMTGGHANVVLAPSTKESVLLDGSSWCSTYFELCNIFAVFQFHFYLDQKGRPNKPKQDYLPDVEWVEQRTAQLFFFERFRVSD